jgi:hypothetical protein
MGGYLVLAGQLYFTATLDDIAKNGFFMYHINQRTNAIIVVCDLVVIVLAIGP